MSPRIYVASKTKHAHRWRDLRAAGLPIVSTWIDDPVDKEPGGAVDHAELWERCVREASTATALVAYVEPGEVLKGAFVEVGAALAHGVPVLLVGDPTGTCWHHRLVARCRDVEHAFERARSIPAAEADICDQCGVGRLFRVVGRTGFPRTTTGSYGRKIVIPDAVPILTCDYCGARLFDSEVIGAIAAAEGLAGPPNEPGKVDVEVASTGDPGRWTFLALVVGFNELVKMSKTIGERVFLRMACDQAWRDYERMGGRLDRLASDGDAVVLALRDKLPEVVFLERDVELMRAAVAEHDARKAWEETP